MNECFALGGCVPFSGRNKLFLSLTGLAHSSERTALAHCDLVVDELLTPQLAVIPTPFCCHSHV
jgi:hypothetical protein